MKRKKGMPTYPGSRKLYAVLSVLIVLESIGIIAQAVFLARAVSLLFQRTPLVETLSDMALFFAAFAVRYGLSHVQQYVAENYAQKTSRHLRNKLIQAYFQHGFRFAETKGTGRLVTLAIEGIDQLKQYLEIIAIRTIRALVVPGAIVIYIATIDHISALILILSVPIVIIFMILLGLAAQKMADKQYATYRILANHFTDSLKGLETLKYLGKSIAHARSINQVGEQYRRATNRTLRMAFLSSFALDFFSSLSIAFVAVGLGFRLIDGSIPLMPALTILLLAPEYFLPIKQVGSDYHATLDGQVAMEQIDSIINTAEINVGGGLTYTWKPASRIVLQHVSAGDERPILQGINFSWTGHGMIGIVGESGAGKSSFLHLLAGYLQPTNGRFYVDEQDVSSMKDGWMQQMAYIPQHPYIFPATLADNIRFYAPKASDDAVKRVIRAIDLESFVEQLPNGIHENIGEGGRMLSGGQEQRIAMARVLLSDKPIVLLDEPTAHLDIETEYEIKQMMLRVFRHRLVFLATHRQHWMQAMDHLLVLQNGQIVERGTHGELLQKRGIYYDLRKGGRIDATLDLSLSQTI